ncbi:Altered inheritance of mitochondria protein 6-like protein [Exophiala dermatitidis]
MIAAASLLAVALPLALKVSAAPLPASATAEGLDISQGLQNILANTHGSDAYTYPTDLTRGIVPKPIHSHNDYWRDVPFYTALSVGAISVEADVYLYNDTLYVGHEISALTPKRTLDSLYIQPILDVLKRENPSSEFVPKPTHNGVYDTSSGQTLYLFIDLKSAGNTTWPAVVEALQPLRDAKYLSTWNGTGITWGPVTVIGTGNTPLDQVQPVQQRDYFFDANLALLKTDQANITAGVSPVASTQFSKYIGEIEDAKFNDTQLEILRGHIEEAKKRGILARYWDTPAWPLSTRNAVWTTLVHEGVGLLNADDLPEAAGFGGVAGFW